MRTPSRMISRIRPRFIAQGQVPGGPAPGGGSGGDVLPSGALFDMNPEAGILVDQAGGLTLTNVGGLAVALDAIMPFQVLQHASSGHLETVGTPVADFDAEVPFTIYWAYRVSENDSGVAGFLGTLANGTSNYACANFIGGDEFRARVNSSSGAGVKDTSGKNLPGQATYVLSVTFFPSGQVRIAIDDDIGSIVDLSNTSRDPGTFLKYVLGASASGGNRLRGEHFRNVIFSGDRRADVAGYLERYSPPWTAGADLDVAADGTCKFDWRPVKTGDYSNARDGSAAKLYPTIVNGYGGIGTTDSIPHLKPTATSDEMLLFTYPGAASLNACVDDKILVMAAFRTSATGAQDLFSIGDNTSGGDRLYVTVDASTGQVTATYKDTSASVSQAAGTVPTSALVNIVAVQFEYGAGAASIGVAVNGNAMVSFSEASLAGLDVALTNLILAGQYSTKTTGTGDSAYLGLVVFEGQEYSQALAAQFALSVRTTALLTSGLGYGGPNPDDLIAWWSATQPLVSHEGNNYQVAQIGTPGTGTFGGRDYATFPTTSDGYEFGINPKILEADESLVMLTTFYTPAKSAIICQLVGAQASARPDLYHQINTSTWLYARVHGETGALTTDQLNPSGYTVNAVNVAMCRVTKASDGLSYQIEVGVNGVWSGTPTTKVATDLGTHPFLKMVIGAPGTSNNPVGVWVFDSTIHHDTGTAIDTVAASNYLSGLITP